MRGKAQGLMLNSAITSRLRNREISMRKQVGDTESMFNEGAGESPLEDARQQLWWTANPIGLGWVRVVIQSGVDMVEYIAANLNTYDQYILPIYCAVVSLLSSCHKGYLILPQIYYYVPPLPLTASISRPLPRNPYPLSLTFLFPPLKSPFRQPAPLIFSFSLSPFLFPPSTSSSHSTLLLQASNPIISFWNLSRVWGILCFWSHTSAHDHPCSSLPLSKNYKKDPQSRSLTRPYIPR